MLAKYILIAEVFCVVPRLMASATSAAADWQALGYNYEFGSLIMSFFFDVWMEHGFVLASDVRLIGSSESAFLHKIAIAPASSKITAAIAVCGDYPKSCKDYFSHAVAVGDSFREVAYDFAKRWTERFAGSGEYSAAHLVGYEVIPGTNERVPQVWYWRNWAGEYLSKSQLEDELSTFSQTIPFNNHIPEKLSINRGQISSLEDELRHVKNYLRQHQRIFTWNGDTSFWRSALEAVSSALDLIADQKDNWSLADGITVASACLRFLTTISTLLPDSTVGLSPEGEFDLVVVSEEEARWINRSTFPEET